MSTQAKLGTSLVGVVLLTILIGLLWMPYGPNAIDLDHTLAAPSLHHWFGTDEFGRDVLSRAMLGARISVLIALGAVTLAITAGTTLGLLAGYLRGWTDRLLMMVTDAVLAFPSILLALALIAVLGSSDSSIVIALATGYTPSVVRVVRSAVLSIREREFIEASRVAGDNAIQTMARHVLPNIVPPVVVLATSLFGWALLSESALSFLGVGVPPPAPTWGNMLSGSRTYMDVASWLSIAPGLCIAGTLLGINLLGDALRDWLDPAGAHMTLLKFEGVRIEAPGRTLLEDLSFEMATGEMLAVVGESGSGKTLAARAILRLLPPNVRQSAGRIELLGRDLTRMSAPELQTVRGAQAGMVFQEPMVSLNPAMTIERQLAEGLRLHRRLPGEEIRRRSIAMLERVRIRDPLRCLKSYPHEFSGGMRQRIMLASVLLLQPKLLIADEPTTALDTLSQREVLELMVELARDTGAAVLLITHDLGLVARYTSRAVVLEKGRLMETGTTQQILTNPRNPYTRRLVESLPRGHAGVAAVSASARTVLEVRDASIDYPGRPGLLRAGAPKRVVHGVSLEVRAGEIVALVGASGSGKSTLGRAVLGLKPLAAGSVRFDGTDLASMTAQQLRQFRRSAQLVFQDPYSSLDPRLRIRDIIAASLRDSADKDTRVQAILEEVGLPSFGSRFPHQMSGGQRQRVAIARAVVSRPRLVVADEPVSALDMTIQQQVLTLFQKLQTQYGFACLFITHDLAVVRQIASRVIVMSAGSLVEEGPVATVFRNPQHEYTRELLDATPTLQAIPGSGQSSH